MKTKQLRTQKRKANRKNINPPSIKNKTTSKNNIKKEPEINKTTTKNVIGLIFIAYFFSILVRMIWVLQFNGDAGSFWNDQLMINTNDGYYFASGVQKELFGMHSENPRIPEMWNHGLVFFTALLAKITPFSVESLLLYLPGFFSSLVVIPIILISRLYNHILWGFLASLLASITWSYYNRTMFGYYDTDMFAAMIPIFILYFFIKNSLDFNLRSSLYASIIIVLYPFFFDQGKIIVYGLGLMYIMYMLLLYRKEKKIYSSFILVFMALIPFYMVSSPYSYIIHILSILIVYFILNRKKLEQKTLVIISGVLFFLFLLFGNVFGLVYEKIAFYLSISNVASSTNHLHFLSVIKTVREAGQIPFSLFSNRVSGSELGFILSIAGYIVLVFKHRSFILSLPLVFIGFFALSGGLRFTVYMVPIAAMSLIYLFVVIGDLFNNKKATYAFIIFTSLLAISPNIKHIMQYKVYPVFNNSEVKDLQFLNKISSSKDYTLTWWDYGYPIWYYSDTSTLIDGGKHNNDNFLISTILQSTSQDLAANLSRLSVETYVDSNFSIVSNVLFKDNNPNILLSELEDPNYSLPDKTRDIYLYLPFRMIHILPTVFSFGNIDLTSGINKKEVAFIYGNIVNVDKDWSLLSNGFSINSKKGLLYSEKYGERPIKELIVRKKMSDGHEANYSKIYNNNAAFDVIFLSDYNSVIILDSETRKSAYVQMYILGNYDENLFELVRSSEYSKIYKLKK